MRSFYELVCFQQWRLRLVQFVERAGNDIQLTDSYLIESRKPVLLKLSIPPSQMVPHVLEYTEARMVCENLHTMQSLYSVCHLQGDLACMHAGVDYYWSHIVLHSLQGLWTDAAGFYESTLQYQPEFQPAADRLWTVRCHILLARAARESQQNL